MAACSCLLHVLTHPFQRSGQLAQLASLKEAAAGVRVELDGMQQRRAADKERIQTLQQALEQAKEVGGHHTQVHVTMQPLPHSIHL